jgi:hypothetical protein
MANLSNINNKFLVTTGGNVGIANTSPTLSTLTVGIGSTNSPSQICQLAGSGSGVYSVLSLTNTNGIAADNNGVGLDFHVNAAYSATGRIQLIHPTAQSGTTTNASMQFLTYGTVSGVTTFSPRMTIDYRGNVGIGTTTPSTKLHLGGTAPGDSIIRQDSTTSGTNWEIGERAAGKWQIFEDDGNTIVTTFMSTGNVGIGTESPNFKLHVSGTGGSDTLLRLENTTVNKYPNLRFTAAGAEYDIGVGGTGTATGYVHNFYIYDITNSAPRITLTQAGNVGIGTQSPNKALTVYGGNDNGIWIDSQGAQYTSLAFGHNGTEKANIAWDNTNGYTSISTYANGS